MKKGIIIGVFVVIIIAIIIGTSSSLNLEKNNDSSIENIVEEETTLVEEITPVPENTGKDISVELTESMGIKSP